MRDLPIIKQEIFALETLEKKLSELNALEIDYESKEIKQHFKSIKKIEKFLEILKVIVDLHRECQNLLELKNSELWEVAEIEYEEKIENFEQNMEKLYDEVSKSQEETSDEIILEIRAGTGGDEASLFAMEMLKLYTKFLEDNKFSYEVVDISKNEIGGIKSCSISMAGNDILSYFRFESGVHRVQRVPITVAILKCDEDDINIEVNPNDLKVDTYRASGAGGQHVNKTDSAVRLTHIPSGIITQCQEERSQIKNREKAMKILRIKLREMEKSKKQVEVNKVRELLIGTGDRSEKSKTYNFPQNRITDHLLNITLYQLDIIMNGNFEILYNASYEAFKKQKLQTVKNIDTLLDLC